MSIIYDISASNIRNVLEESSATAVTLCRSPKINKWAKYKPINYPALRPLHPDEFKGADIGDHIFYGIKAGMRAGNWSDLHNATYEYLGRPHGGEQSPYRLSDFHGYDSNALPELSGSTLDIAEGMIRLQVNRAAHNDRAVSLNDLVGSLKGGFEALYPCVMVDNYIHALYNVDTGRYTKLTDGNVQRSSFQIDVPSMFSQQQVRTVTFFLSQYINRIPIIDMQNQWVDTADQISSIPTIISIPEVAGLRMIVRGYDSSLLIVTPEELPSGSYRLVFDGSEGVRLTISDTIRVVINGITNTYYVEVHFVPVQSGEISTPGDTSTPSFRVHTYIDISASDFGLSSLRGRSVRVIATAVDDGRAVTKDFVL